MQGEHRSRGQVDKNVLEEEDPLHLARHKVIVEELPVAEGKNSKGELGIHKENKTPAVGIHLDYYYHVEVGILLDYYYPVEVGIQVLGTQTEDIHWQVCPLGGSRS